MQYMKPSEVEALLRLGMTRSEVFDQLPMTDDGTLPEFDYEVDGEMVTFVHPKRSALPAILPYTGYSFRFVDGRLKEVFANEHVLIEENGRFLELR